MPASDDDILGKILNLILNLSPDAKGEVRLPTERKLAEQLNIQRPTVRERLSTLETLGFVNRTQGRGTYLAMARSSVIQFYFEIAMKLGYIGVEEMQGAMEMIVREAAASAAVSASADNIRRLAEAVEKPARDDSIDSLVTSQFEFHSAVVRASGNPVIALIFEGIAKVVREVLRRKIRVMQLVSGALNRNLEARRYVVEAIQNREPDTTRTAIDEYFWLWRREEAKISILNFGEFGGGD
ncbi:MAG: FCD domain-containing protein [Planctomycetota bacterium]|nr:FCD domain-containing protein [Planctomycetota bacterium]